MSRPAALSQEGSALFPTLGCSELSGTAVTALRPDPAGPRLNPAPPLPPFSCPLALATRPRPQSYTSFLAPVTTHKLYHEVRNFKDLEHFETPYVVRLYR